MRGTQTKEYRDGEDNSHRPPKYELYILEHLTITMLLFYIRFAGADLTKEFQRKEAVLVRLPEKILPRTIQTGRNNQIFSFYIFSNNFVSEVKFIELKCKTWGLYSICISDDCNNSLSTSHYCSYKSETHVKD